MDGWGDRLALNAYNIMVHQTSYQSYLHSLDLSSNHLKLLPEGIFQVNLSCLSGLSCLTIHFCIRKSRDDNSIKVDGMSINQNSGN